MRERAGCGQRETRRSTDENERRGENVENDHDARGTEKNCSLPSTPAARSHQLPFFLSSREFNPRMKVANTCPTADRRREFSKRRFALFHRSNSATNDATTSPRQRATFPIGFKQLSRVHSMLARDSVLSISLRGISTAILTIFNFSFYGEYELHCSQDSLKIELDFLGNQNFLWKTFFPNFVFTFTQEILSK